MNEKVGGNILCPSLGSILSEMIEACEVVIEYGIVGAHASTGLHWLIVWSDGIYT